MTPTPEERAAKLFRRWKAHPIDQRDAAAEIRAAEDAKAQWCFANMVEPAKAEIERLRAELLRVEAMTLDWVISASTQSRASCEANRPDHPQECGCSELAQLEHQIEQRVAGARR